MKIKMYPHGHAMMEKMIHSGMYLVQLRIGDDLVDKIRTDDYQHALAYFRTFAAQAKNANPTSYAVV